MDLENSLMIFFIIAFELNIFYFTACNLFDSRKNNIYSKITLSLFIYILVVFTVLNTDNIAYKYIIVIALIFILMNILFEAKKILLFLTTTAIYSLFTAVDYVLLIAIHTDTSIYELITNELHRLLGLSILSRLICLLIILFSTKHKMYKIDLKSSQLIKFIILLLFTMFGIIAGIIPDYISLVSPKILIPLIFTFNIFFVYYIFNDFIDMSNSLRIKSINEERRSNELKLWLELKEQDKIYTKIMHDYTNNLICIKGLLDDNNIMQLKEYINNITKEYKLVKKFVSTENVLLDVLINNKYEKALQHDISMILRLDKLNDIKISNEDLIVLLSNLIDNALECCQKLQNNKKEIFLSVKQRQTLQIIIRNPIEKNIEINNNLIKSSKKGNNHGIGLSNVKDIIEKYKGQGSINIDDGYFTYLIEFN